MSNLTEKKEYFCKVSVTDENTAKAMKSGSLDVFATPAVVALMEQAASLLADEYIEDIYTTVGTKISVEHISPTPVGDTVTATATLVKHEGRVFEFELVAKDKSGVIATGLHTRVSVNSKKFQEKADGKIAK